MCRKKSYIKYKDIKVKVIKMVYKLKKKTICSRPANAVVPAVTTDPVALADGQCVAGLGADRVQVPLRLCAPPAAVLPAGGII